MKPLVLIVAWFGPWPAWINITLETCRANPDVDWLIVTDQDLPESQPPNVRFIQMTMAAFFARAETVTGQRISAPKTTYKLVDLKPAYGAILAEEISAYRHFGFADMDVFYGNIRKFYSDEFLQRYDVISTHRERLCGHLAVFRNTRRLRDAYRKMPHWREVLASERPVGMEKYFTRLFRPRGPVGWLVGRLRFRSLFVEQFSTVGKRIAWHDGSSVSPEIWQWRRGQLTTLHDGPGREFLYLHFMIWQSARWRKDGAPAPWPLLEGGPVKIDWRRVQEGGFLATPSGVLGLD